MDAPAFTSCSAWMGRGASGPTTRRCRWRGKPLTCYTDMVEMEPGEIFLVFDTSYTNSWRRGEVDIRLARVSVRRE